MLLLSYVRGVEDTKGTSSLTNQIIHDIYLCSLCLIFDVLNSGIHFTIFKASHVRS